MAEDSQESGRFSRWRPGKGAGARSAAEADAGIVGYPTDANLLQYFYRKRGLDVHPIATDSFLDKSRNEYNAAWLTRELVQNFVDHNPAHPGTLDGVRFT